MNVGQQWFRGYSCSTSASIEILFIVPATHFKPYNPSTFASKSSPNRPGLLARSSAYIFFSMSTPYLAQYLTIQWAEMVSSMRILGVVINLKQIMVDNLDHLLRNCASSIHPLRMLITHCLQQQQQQLNVVASSTTMTSLLYASPAWWGYTSAD